MDEVRINKFLSEAGILSRRQVDQYIADGRIMVNGSLPTMGMKVTDQDQILIDGKPVVIQFSKKYYALYKPVGIVCTSEKMEKDNLTNYLLQTHHMTEKLIYVGRLDKMSEGLLLLTTDGDLSNRIQKARYGHEKEYIVTVNRPFDDEFITQMKQGVPILDTVTRECKVKRISAKTFSIVLTQGLNRQIRRMCEALGYRVVKLKRIRVMNVSLDHMKPGEIRELSTKEVEELKRLVERGFNVMDETR